MNGQPAPTGMPFEVFSFSFGSLKGEERGRAVLFPLVIGSASKNSKRFRRREPPPHRLYKGRNHRCASEHEDGRRHP